MQQVSDLERRFQDVSLVSSFFSLLPSFLFNTKSTGIFISACPCFILSKTEKINKKMDPIFEHPVFNSAREKLKRFIIQLKKSQEALKTRCTLVSNVVATIYFLLQNRSCLLMREHLYSASVVIVTINGGMDDNV